jgi:hypothetical protein
VEEIIFWEIVNRDHSVLMDVGGAARRVMEAVLGDPAKVDAIPTKQRVAANLRSREPLLWKEA